MDDDDIELWLNTCDARIVYCVGPEQDLYAVLYAPYPQYGAFGVGEKYLRLRLPRHTLDR
jgi:hypothetical protein